MPIAALVLTLEPSKSAAVTRQIACDPRILVGDERLGRLPIAADTRSVAEAEALLDQLGVMDGVAAVDVVAVDFSEDE